MQIASPHLTNDKSEDNKGKLSVLLLPAIAPSFSLYDFRKLAETPVSIFWFFYFHYFSRSELWDDVVY